MPAKQTGIYLIRHRPSGRCYVGQALSIRSRWTKHRKHLSSGTHHSPRLQELWNQDGANSFDFVVIKEVPSGKTELEVQRWLISNELSEYNRLKDCGLLLNAAIPAIVPTTKAKEQYENEKKREDKEQKLRISHLRKNLKEKLQAVLDELHPINEQYEKYNRELNHALKELDRNIGFFATLVGRASSFDTEGCKRQIASLRNKIAQIEPQVMRLRASAEEIRGFMKNLYNCYPDVIERRLRRNFARVGRPYLKPTIE